MFAVLVWLAAPATAAPPSPFDPEQAIAYSQAAIGRMLEDYVFVDSTGAAVSLAAFRGKPLVVNLIFSGCGESCPIIIETLYHAVAVAQDKLGEDAFNVVTIGFDSAADSPARMHDYARAHGIDLANWHFLSGDAETVRRLTDTLGFIFLASPRGFDHLAQTSIVDGDGRIYRQVYGPAFEPPALGDPLLALALGHGGDGGLIEAVIDRVRLFCTYYDAATGRYRFDYSLFVGGAIGGASLFGIGFILVRAWRRAKPPTSHA